MGALREGGCGEGIVGCITVHQVRVGVWCHVREGVEGVVSHDMWVHIHVMCMNVVLTPNRQRTGFVGGDSIMMPWSSLGAGQVGVV